MIETTPGHLPIHSGKVTTETARRLPRQQSGQTREDMLDAGTRLLRAGLLGQSADGRDGDLLSLASLLPVAEVAHQATEIARWRLVDSGRMEPHERIAPLTFGAFYKAFEGDYIGDGPTEKGHALEVLHTKVAERLLDAYRPQPPLTTTIEAARSGAEDIRPYIEADTAETCEDRYVDPSYLFMGSVALIGKRQSTLGASLVAATDKEVAAFAASIQQLDAAAHGNSPELDAVLTSGLAEAAVGVVRQAVSRERTRHHEATAEEDAGRWNLAALGVTAVLGRYQ